MPILNISEMPINICLHPVPIGYPTLKKRIITLQQKSIFSVRVGVFATLSSLFFPVRHAIILTTRPDLFSLMRFIKLNGRI